MPKSFGSGALSRQIINQGLVQSVRLVGEYRGKQALFKQQSPQVLEALRENVIDVNYFCLLATTILAGPEWAEDTTILRPVDLVTERCRASSFSLSSPF